MKQKVINDPVHGFIRINSDLIFKVLEHPYFQRLRYIKQLGLTQLVYPGAEHTRFLHALGAYHLMNKAVYTLRQKGIEISDSEAEAVKLAILLHDIGHGPFSHTLENSILTNTSHETITLFIMNFLNKVFNGKLDLCISIFKNTYKKKFLSKLVSGQLDVDRLDYLSRDSYFTGVSEGIVNYNRLIDMMTVVENDLVVELKGIYSVEKFLVSRSIMYWQVYLHKTVVSAESMLVKIISRAKQLIKTGYPLKTNPSLYYFLKNDNIKIEAEDVALKHFVSLDDSSIHSNIKMWVDEDDFLLSYLCKSLINRNLFKVKITDKKISTNAIERVVEKVANTLKCNKNEASFLIQHDSLQNNYYQSNHKEIKIVNKKGNVKPLSTFLDVNVHKLSALNNKKYFLSYPKL